MALIYAITQVSYNFTNFFLFNKGVFLKPCFVLFCITEGFLFNVIQCTQFSVNHSAVSQCMSFLCSMGMGFIKVFKTRKKLSHKRYKKEFVNSLFSIIIVIHKKIIEYLTCVKPLLVFLYKGFFFQIFGSPET